MECCMVEVFASKLRVVSFDARECEPFQDAIQSPFFNSIFFRHFQPDFTDTSYSRTTVKIIRYHSHVYMYLQGPFRTNQELE